MKKRRDWDRLLPLAAMLLLGLACSGGDTDAPASEEPEAEMSAPDDAERLLATARSQSLVGSWRLVRLVRDEGESVDPVDDAVPTITFTAEANPTGSRLYSGSAGCNRISGAYDAGSTGRLGIAAGAAMTMMACPDPIMRMEQAFMGALERSDAYTVDGDELVIEFDGGSLLMERAGS